jgi:hypothetical protein
VGVYLAASLASAGTSWLAFLATRNRLPFWPARFGA